MAAKKILFICSDLDAPGGLERILTQLASMLSREGYAVTLIITGNSLNSFYPVAKEVEMVLVPLHFGITDSGNYLSRKVDFIKDVRALDRAISKAHPDVIISSDYPYHAALYVAGTYKRYKIFLWQHYVFNNRLNRLWRFLFQKMLRAAHGIITVNDDERAHYLRFNQHTVNIPNFTEKPIGHATPDNKQLLTVAQLAPHKGIDLLLEAASVVLQRYPAWTWKLIGAGPLEGMVKDAMQELPQLKWQAPGSHDLTSTYLSASVYVMTSRMEVFGLALLEAKKHGLPCIAFDCENGPRHLIKHNEDGYLVTGENVPELINHICTLVDDEEKRHAFGKAGYRNASIFYPTAILPQWKTLLESV